MAFLWNWLPEGMRPTGRGVVESTIANGVTALLALIPSMILATILTWLTDPSATPWVKMVNTLVLGFGLALGLLILIGAAGWAYRFWRSGGGIAPRNQPAHRLSDVVNDHYKMCTVNIDNKRFLHCTFEDVTFHWEGVGLFEFVECQYSGKRGISFPGGTQAATAFGLLRTFQLLKEDVAKNFKLTRRDNA